MDGADLAGAVVERWERMTAVDALLDAVERGDLPLVRTLAGDSRVRAALDGETSTRLEVLSCLAASGCAELAEEMVAIVRKEPELVRVRFSMGHTLLHRAAGAWSVFFTEPLLALGADPDARDGAGHPPLYHAGNRFPRPVGVRTGVEQALVAVFHKYGANLDTADGVKLSTPLHMAARRGHAALAEALVSHGANVEARDKNGETPLRRAVNCGQPAVARVLLSLGADPQSRCRRERTPADAARTSEMQRLFHG